MKKLGFVIYRVSWEVYDDEGCYEVFHTEWTLNKKTAVSHKRELLELSKVRKDIHVNDIQKNLCLVLRRKFKNLLISICMERKLVCKESLQTPTFNEPCNRQCENCAFTNICMLKFITKYTIEQYGDNNQFW